MLKSLDLFTGIAGFTVGLEGICTPLLYCDIDPSAQTIVKNLISKGEIPNAPIHEDVKTLKPPQADIVLGGSPCTGFSSTGLREGFKNEASSLWYDMVRIIKESNASFAFQENTPYMCASIDEIIDKYDELGFDVVWTCLAASSMGAPHKRERVYLLAVKRGAKMPQIEIQKVQPWREPPPICMVESKNNVAKRNAALGNSVVPTALRHAFEYLWRTMDNGRHNSVQDCKPSKRTFTAHGICIGGRGNMKPIPSCPTDASWARDFTNIVDPNAFTPQDGYMPRNRLPKLENSIAFSKWPTPRHGNVQPSSVPTKRNIRDLPTFLRFSQHCRDRDLRNPDPGVLEWMMGFKENWTAH